MNLFKLFGTMCLLFLAVACSSSSGSSSDSTTEDESCNLLCTDAGFDSGEEVDFGGGLIECLCDGSGDGIAQEDCTTYCSDFGVAEEDSLLSSEVEEDDKCVCDGTT